MSTSEDWPQPQARWRARQALLLGFSLLLTGSQAQAGAGSNFFRLLLLSGDDTQLIDCEEDAAVSSPVFSDGGGSYDIVKQPASLLDPIIDQQSSGNSYLSFGIDRDEFDDNSDGKQRVEIRWSEYVPFGEEHYTGFRVRVDEDSQYPSDNFNNIMQWWQSAPESPPLAVNLFTEGSSPNERLMIGVFVQNEDHYWDGNVCRCDGAPCPADCDDCCHIELWSQRLEPDNDWTHLVLGYRFDPAGGGWVQIWFEDVAVLDEPWRGKLGYPATIAESQYIGAHKFGLYRRAQRRTMSVHFDDLRRGSSYESVDPAQ